MCLQLLETGQAAAGKKAVLFKVLQHYSQALLDETYVLECRLVNADFPEDRCKGDIRHLIGQLDQPEELVKEMFGSEYKSGQILGSDILECLFWRRGALFYMYCHTLFNDPQRRQLDTTHIRQCAESGVKYLEAMLCVRSPLMMDAMTDVSAKNEDLMQLLKEGIFSDTHLLALVYSGELCYWHWKIVKETTTDQSVKESSDADENCSGNFNSVSNGRRLLQKFVNIVQDCFKGRGWDCSRAEQILAEFPEC